MEMLTKNPYEYREKERGFTLPEVLIVIVILGILVGIAVPVWLGVVESRQVDSATNQFASDLRLAHNKATNQLQEWTLEYQSRSDDQSGSSEYTLKSKDGTTINRTLPDGTVVYSSEVENTSGDEVLKFTPRGKVDADPSGDFTDADGDGEIDLVISQDGNPERVIEIARPTSRVEVVGG